MKQELNLHSAQSLCAVRLAQPCDCNAMAGLAVQLVIRPKHSMMQRNSANNCIAMTTHVDKGNVRRQIRVG
jgi:hypothetical protein